MGISLKNILANNNIIENGCTAFGMSKPKLYPYHENGYLCLSVEVDSNIVVNPILTGISSRMRMGILSFYLKSYFNCDCIIYPADSMDEKSGSTLVEGVYLSASHDDIRIAFDIKDLEDKNFFCIDQSDVNTVRPKRGIIEELGLPKSPVDYEIKSKFEQDTTTQNKSTFWKRSSDQSDINPKASKIIRSNNYDISERNADLGDIQSKAYELAEYITSISVGLNKNDQVIMLEKALEKSGINISLNVTLHENVQIK